MELSKICASLVRIDSTIQSLLFNWHWLACEDMYKFSYPERISGNTLYVCVLSSQSSFFMHYSQRILDNVCAFLGSRRVQKISVKQAFNVNLSNSEYDMKKRNARSLNRDLSSASFEKIDNRAEIFSMIDEKLGVNVDCGRDNGFDNSMGDRNFDKDIKSIDNKELRKEHLKEERMRNFLKNDVNTDSNASASLNAALKNLYCAMFYRKNLQRKICREK